MVRRGLGMSLAPIVSCLVVASVAQADGLARHKKIYAVPCPGKVKIDGKLDDWDLSGQILMYVMQESSTMQSARFALMYDAEAIYLSAVIRDPSPMMNRHDPRVDPDKGWNADSCQFRLVTDRTIPYPYREEQYRKDNRPDQPYHLILWYYTDRKEPVLQMFRSMSYKTPREEWIGGVVPRDQFKAAYLMAKDKLGYTFEYRIPWEVLCTGEPPRAGDLLAGTVQFNWSAPDGLKIGGVGYVYDVMSGPGFPYQSTACWGKIIFSERGNLPRELLEEDIAPEKPKPLAFTYDLPEDGDVTLQLFDANGTISRILVASAARRAGRNVEYWDGLDETGKPLAAGTYTWKGLYHQPLKTKFILSAHNSGQPPYKTDDGTGGWGGDHGNSTTVCAAGDTMLLAWSMSESGWGIIKTDLRGKKLLGLRHNAMDLATDGKRIFVAGDNGYEGAWSVKPFDIVDGRPLNWGNGKPTLDPPAGGDDKTNLATAVAYARGTLYVSWGKRNLVTVHDAKTGSLEETWHVPAPARLAPRPDGSIAVISEGKILAVRKGKLSPLISDHIDKPSGLAVDKDGTIYVANCGSLQNISVFSSKGEYLRSIGKEGGRPRVGRYENSGILEPGGIALDKKGRLWVAETLDSPKRQSVWDTRTGALVYEFFGGSSYFGWAYMDPKHPDELYCHSVLWKVDLDKGTCIPWSTIWRSVKPNMICEPNPNGYAGHFRVMTAKNGRQFGWGMVDYSQMVYMRDGDVFKPFVGTIRISHGIYGAGAIYPIMDDPKKYPDGAYLWQDANDDQTIQESELIKSPAGRGEVVFNWLDPDLNAWCDAGWIYRPVRFEGDRPVYDFAKMEPIPWKGSNANACSLWLDNQDDTVYTFAPYSEPSLVRWTRDAKILWAYQRVVPWNLALGFPVVTPGRLWGLTMPLTVAGDYTGVASYFGPYHIFTRDGIYVGMVMRDGRSGGGLGPDITASEVVTGQLVKPDGMDRYFLLAGDQDGRVTEIFGLDTVKRLPGGTYVHSEADAKKAADALTEYAREQARSQCLDIARGRHALDSTRPVTRPVDANRAFTARAAYDAKNLYISYDVTSPFELVNDISDPRLIFKGGNLLDIQLGTDPAADPKRKSPVPGDIRILVTLQKGKPFAVIYRPKVKDFKGDPIVLTSPTGKESFDRIEPTDKIGLQYQKRPGGFLAIAEIPLDLLGWTPKPGQTIKMDLGYLFGNATGSQIALRAYWTNNSFSANVTNDVPNESRLEPAEWGTATVE